MWVTYTNVYVVYTYCLTCREGIYGNKYTLIPSFVLCQRQNRKQGVALSIGFHSAILSCFCTSSSLSACGIPCLIYWISLYSSKFRSSVLLWEDMAAASLDQATSCTSSMLSSTLFIALPWRWPAVHGCGIGLFYVQDYELIAEGFMACLSLHPQCFAYNRNLIHVKRRKVKMGWGNKIQWWWMRRL